MDVEEVPVLASPALPSEQPIPYRSRRSRTELGLTQITFDPRLESIEEALSNPSHISHERGTCARLFRQAWWNPRFYSRPLEKQLQKKAIEFLRNRYRATEVWLSLFALLWIAFFSIQIPLSDVASIAIARRDYSWEMIVGGVVFLLCVITLLALSLTKIYKRFPVSLSLALCLLLMVSSWLLVPSILIQVTQPSQYSSLSLINQFTISAIVILVIYTLSHKPILYCITLGVIYAIVLETLVVVFGYGILYDESGTSVPTTDMIVKMTVARLFLHICLNMVGFSTANWFQVRLHQTFWKVAHCLILQKALTLDRQLQEKTIASLMPPELARELGEKFNEHAMFNVRSKLQDGDTDEPKEAIARPLTVHHTDNVSILFADIVGFTTLSSNMSAEELVGILNEIFSTFDDLVSEHNCEKVCTLGDCYFCVSGCPQPCDDHAANAVNMGLSIIEALREYSASHSLEISMRVGIHTGSVYYGVMGSQRFRFDVWSKDVNIANQIESAGVAGKVLLSETTQRQLSGAYLLEEVPSCHLSASLPDMKYFVVQGKRHTHQGSGASWRKKIRNIDVQVVADTPTNEVAIDCDYSCSTESSTRSPLPSFLTSCCPSIEPQDSSGRATVTHSSSSSSIMDIFSRQNQLDRCASLAEVNHPFTNHQSTVVTQIMELMEESDVNFDTFFRTSLHPITLLFDDEGLEKTYRNCGRDLGDCTAGRNPESEFGFVVAKMSYFIDVLLSVCVLFLVSFASLLTMGSQQLEFVFLGVFFGMGVVIEVPILIIVMSATWPKRFPSCFKWFSEKILNWKVKTVVGLLMTYYPMVLVYVGLVVCQPGGGETFQAVMRTEMSFYIAMTVLVASVLFMDVSFIAKVVAAVLNIIAVEVLAATVHVSLCYASSNLTTTAPVSTAPESPTHHSISVDRDINTYFLRFVVPLTTIFSFLLAILLATVNRKSEISVRMSFKGRVEAVLQQQEMKQHRDQATWLIHHLIPTHVISDLRLQGKYSQNHACVGVIFATIVNASEFYELESEHAIDCMRVLNDIVAGFDELLERKEFAGVDKIKTIGASTYMAASGLDFHKESNQSQGHLVNLINFSMEMLTFIQYVNQSLQFDFKLRIGFNYGPATSGVVGRSKLLFDIWGDTVNIASRMDTTGQVNRIHLPEECSSLLINYFSFEPCGETIVKGKGIMPTMLVKGRKRQFIRFEVLPEEESTCSQV